MTQTKKTFAEIIEIENLQLDDAGIGMAWAEYPSGKKITAKNARYMLTIKINEGRSVYVSNSITSLIISAFKDSRIDLNKYGYNTCSRCNGEGRLIHYSHINSGICLKCNGIGLI